MWVVFVPHECGWCLSPPPRGVVSAIRQAERWGPNSMGPAFKSCFCMAKDGTHRVWRDPHTKHQRVSPQNVLTYGQDQSISVRSAGWLSLQGRENISANLALVQCTFRRILRWITLCLAQGEEVRPQLSHWSSLITAPRSSSQCCLTSCSNWGRFGGL